VGFDGPLDTRIVILGSWGIPNGFGAAVEEASCVLAHGDDWIWSVLQLQAYEHVRRPFPSALRKRRPLRTY
jgi:hypothetical protein